MLRVWVFGVWVRGGGHLWHLVAGGSAREGYEEDEKAPLHERLPRLADGNTRWKWGGW